MWRVHIIITFSSESVLNTSCIPSKCQNAVYVDLLYYSTEALCNKVRMESPFSTSILVSMKHLSICCPQLQELPLKEDTPTTIEFTYWDKPSIGSGKLELTCLTLVSTHF